MPWPGSEEWAPASLRFTQISAVCWALGKVLGPSVMFCILHSAIKNQNAGMAQCTCITDGYCAGYLAFEMVGSLSILVAGEPPVDGAEWTPFAFFYGFLILADLTICFACLCAVRNIVVLQ